MDEAGREGRTILFVSHNMAVISQLCSTCIWLDQGKVKDFGKTDAIVNSYMLNGISRVSGEKTFSDDQGKAAQLKSVSLLDGKGNATQQFDCDNAITIKLDILVRKQLPGLYGYLGIVRPDGTSVLVSDSFDGSTGNPLDGLPVGMNSFMVTVPPRTLGHGEYMVHFSMASQAADDFHVDVPGIVCSFSLEDLSSRRGNQRAGYFSTLLPWQKFDN